MTITTDQESATPATPGGPRDRLVRALVSPRTSLVLGVVLLVLGAIVLAWPWLSAPLAADERYQYLLVAGRTDNSFVGVIERIWRETPSRAESGRITPIGYLMQHLSFLAVFKASLATGTSVVVGHAVVKLVMLGLAVLAFRWLLRALRVRGERLSTGTRRLLIPLFGLLLLIGGQTQVLDRSSWTAYPVLTSGAIAVSFGTVALMLNLSDRLARSPRWLILIVPVLVLMAAFLNFSYELYYVAVPLAVLVLLVHSPPAEQGRAWLQRHARLVVGGGLTLLFGIGLIWVRRTVTAICSEPGRSCYVGTEASLGLDTVTVSLRNLLGSIPLFAGSHVGRDRLDRAPWLEDPGFAEGLGWVGALLAIAGLVLLTTRWIGAAAGEPVPADPRPQRAVLAVVAATGLAMAGGSAVIMALSAQAPEIVVELGVPYRSTTVIWAGLALTGLAGVAMLVTGRGRWAFTLPVAAMAVVTLVIGVIVWPTMAQSTRIALGTPRVGVVQEAYRTVLTPDLTQEGEAERCAVLERIPQVVPGGTADRLEIGVTESFEVVWGRPYCSAEPEGDGG